MTLGRQGTASPRLRIRKRRTRDTALRRSRRPRLLPRNACTQDAKCALVGSMCPIAQQGPELKAYEGEASRLGRKLLSSGVTDAHASRKSRWVPLQDLQVLIRESAPERAHVLGRQVSDQPRLKAISVGASLTASACEENRIPLDTFR